MQRLNDWVPQVRQAAQEALPTIFQLSAPKDVADAIVFTLTHWSSWKRITNSDRESLISALADKDIAAIIKDKIVTSPSGSLTMVLAYFGRSTAIEPYLVEIAQLAVQPAVRAKAYRYLLDGKVSWVAGKEWEWTDKQYGKRRVKPIIAKRELTISYDFLTTLKEAAIDRSSIVRRVSAEFLIREMVNLGSDSLQLANLFASDKSKAVAERGKFALKNLAAIIQ